MLNLEAIR
jgi:hypothetical protein